MPAIRFHLERLTPQRALLISWAIWGVLFAAAPVAPVIVDSTAGLVLLVVCNLALLLGLNASRFIVGPTKGPPCATIDEAKLRKMLIILIVAGTASFFIRFFDYFVVRGIPLSLNVQDIRSNLETAGPNLISALYGIIAPATVASGLLAIVLIWSGARGALPRIALLPFIATPLFSFLYGGRGVLFLIGGITVLALLLAAPRITQRLIVGVGAGAVVAFFVMMALFLTRFDELDADVMDVARSSRFTELVPVSDQVLAVIDTASEQTSRLIFYLVSVAQYYIHGVFEFLSTVKEKAQMEGGYLWGRNQFFVVNQVIAVFQGERVELEEFNPSSGVYSTFWGPAFLDFGYVVTPIYGFLFGVVVDYFRRRVATGDLFAFPLYVLFLLQIALVPVHNGIMMVAALYYNIGLFGVWIVGQRVMSGPPAGGRPKKDTFTCQLAADPLVPAPIRSGAGGAILAAGEPHHRPAAEPSREQRSTRGTSPMAVVEVPNPHLQAAEQPAPDLPAAEPSAPRPGLQRLIAAFGASWRFGLAAAVVALILVLAALAAIRLAVPATTTFRSSIQLTFPEAPLGTYPNGVPYSINEIIEPAVLNRVYEQLKLDQYGLKRDDFYAAFSIRPFNPSELEISDRFRQRLADRRLTFAERERLEAQHKTQLDQAARSSAEITLTFHQRIPLPKDVGLAVVQMVPLVWSQQAIEQKGALRFPGYFTTTELLPTDSIQRLSGPLAVITALEAGSRMRSRFSDLASLPGIVTMTDPVTRRSFRDFEAQFRELELFHVNVLFSMLTHYDFGAGNSQVERLVDRHMRDLGLRSNYEQKMADAVQETIRRFVDSVVGLKGRQGGDRRPGDQAVSGPSTIPQISEGFIDRIIELSARGKEAEQTFISNMTQRQLAHQERVIALNAEQAKWKELLDALQSKGGVRAAHSPESRAEFVEALAATVKELNLLWGALTRIQIDFAENRVGRTARLFVPFQASARTEHPVFQSWLILSLLAFGLLVTVAFWCVGAWRTVRSHSRGPSV